MKTLFIEKGKDIIQEGALSDCAYIIVSGSVEVSKQLPGGKKHLIAMLKESDLFGEIGLIDGLPRSATVTALENCCFRVLSRESFHSLGRNNPGALMPVLKIMAARLRSTLIQLQDLRRDSEENEQAVTSSFP